MLLRHFLQSAALAGILGLMCCASQAQPAGAQGENFLYRVVQGDTLGELAQRYTSGAFNWAELQRINSVADPARLPIARLLRIPFSMIPEVPASAVVRHVAGQATVDGQALSQSSTVAEGQTVATGPNGFVTLQLADDSLLSVPPDASLTLTRLRTFQGTGLTDSIVRMENGSVESQVAPRDTGVGRFEVRTPVSVTGVRGTRLRVHVSSDGSRSEVVSGHAGVDAARDAEVMLREKQGVAVNQAGQSLGVRQLLPAPKLSAPQRGGSGWSVDFPPIPGASAYLVTVASDPQGSDVVLRSQAPAPPVQFNAPGPGTYYVFVRAMDDVGIGGLDARQPFEGRPVLQTGGGLPVSTGYGGFISVADY